jgi:hypothetical protein
MENTEQLSAQDLKVQGLIDSFLRARVSNSEAKFEGEHLDDDSLTAFVEGNLSERESEPVVSHLVDCSFCRHITTELVRLDLAFAADEHQVTVNQNEQPSKISEVLNGLLSRIFGTSENAVFAHQEDENDAKKENEAEENKKE